MRELASFLHPRYAIRNTSARSCLRVESLEDRAMPSGVEWLVRIQGLPGDTTAEQMEAARQLFEAARLEEADIEVVDHAGPDGFIVVETPEETPQEIVEQELQGIPGFVDVQPFFGEEESEGGEQEDGGFPEEPPVDEGPVIAGGANVNVGLVGNEPIVAVNPLNPNNVAVAQFNNGSQTLKLSLDGGATFPISRNGVLVPGQTFFQGDDSLAFDAAGRLFWSYLSGGSPSGPNVNVVQINPTTGAVVSGPVLVATSNLDKGWLAADKNPASPFANNLYVIWHDFSQLNAPVRIARSTNQGATWTILPGNISGPGEGFTWPSEVTVAPNGDVWVAWHTNTIGNGSNGEARMRRSADGGLTFGPEIIPFPAGTADTQVTAGSADYGPPVPPRINGLKSWLQGSLQPRILVDPARPGNIYIVSVDDPDNVYDAASDPSDIVLARSTDNGATWTQSIISHGAAGTIQIMPAAAIDTNGNITVTWYDNRGGLTNAAGDFLLDVYSTSSFDGGLTFSSDTRINDLSFDPDFGAPDRFGNQTLRIGEYNGLALAGGTAYAVWTGNSATGQQIVFGKFTTGFSVVSSVPAAGQVVTVAPTDFVIQLAGAVDPATVQPSDLSVNGVGATSFSINGTGDTITFHYITSPATTQGLQSMSIPAGAMTRLADSSPLTAFFATFRYDVVPLTVTSTAPPFPGGTFILPGPFTYDVNFSEPFDPASLQATDLILSGLAGASASSVTALNGNTTARFTISGITSEGTLSANIPTAAITDAFGNPGQSFSAAYQVDYGTVNYPSLTAKPPLGSLVYDPSIAGTINIPGDVDNFTLNVDPGQTISVLVDPAGSPDPGLFGGVGNGAGAAAGQLLSINQTTAASTVVGDPVTPGGLTGLVYDSSSGVFLGSTINGGVSTLVRINPDTGALISTVGTITNGPGGPTLSIGDLAIQPGTNTLFGISSNAGSAGGLLYTINKASGVATLVGNTGSGAGGGIAFAPDGSLYQTAFNNGFDFVSLNTIDPTTAARLSTVPLSTYFDGPAIRPTDGTFFAALGGSDTTISTINPTPGAATLIGNTSASTSDLAFRPSTALAPTVELRDPSNALIGSVSAGPGLNALLQSVTTTTGGVYTISVQGGSSIGNYTLQVTLNASFENETNLVGVGNDTRAAAQNMDGSFVTVQAPQAGLQRGAVLGGNAASAPVPFVNLDFESGTQGFTVNNGPVSGHVPGLWHLSTGRGAQTGHSPVTSFYFGQGEGPSGGGNYNVGNTAGNVTSAPLALPGSGPVSLSFNYVLQTEGNGSFDVASVQVSNNGGATFTTNASSTSSAQLPLSTTWRAASFDLSSFAGQTVLLRFNFDTIDSISNNFE